MTSRTGAKVASGFQVLTPANRHRLIRILVNLVVVVTARVGVQTGVPAASKAHFHGEH